MNRLGVIVDLSHTSDETASQAIQYSRAPVIWSHSSARAIHDVPRNLPDSILKLIGTGPGQKDAIVMVCLHLLFVRLNMILNFKYLQINFFPLFVAVEGNATTAAVADHVEHVAKVAGKKQYVHLLHANMLIRSRSG